MGMSGVGETLRHEREKRNLELEQISRELKISPRFLEAIEKEQFAKLPGTVFAKSFVRQYARMLGLDEEELAAEVERAVELSPLSPKSAEPSRLPAADIRVPRVETWQDMGERPLSWSSSLPALALVVVVMLVCSGVYAWWQRQRTLASSHEQSPAPIAAPVETARAPQSPPPATPPQSTPVPQTRPPAPTASEKSSPAENSPSSASRRADEPARQAGADLPAEPRANTPAPNPNAAVRVQVTADDTVWVLARGDGKYLFSATLEPNQSRTVEANESVLLRLGNAGGVTISLNGKPIGSVGPKGQVRTVQFTSGGFQIVADPKPSLPLDEDIL